MGSFRSGSEGRSKQISEGDTEREMMVNEGTRSRESKSK